MSKHMLEFTIYLHNAVLCLRGYLMIHSDDIVDFKANLLLWFCIKSRFLAYL